MYEQSDENGKILRARMLQWMKEELEKEPDDSLVFSPRNPDEVCAEMVAEGERMGFV